MKPIAKPKTKLGVYRQVALQPVGGALIVAPIPPPHKLTLKPLAPIPVINGA